MELQTRIPLHKESPSIDYGSKVLLLGSCFAEHIGAKLAYYQFQSCINPLGIYFHPKAIEGLIQRLVRERAFTREDVFMLNEQWHSFEAHSRVSQNSEEALLEVLNKQLKATQAAITQATHIFITLGSAWGYQLRENGKWVANCHKVPQKQFAKVLWEVEDIQTCLGSIIDMIGHLNTDVQVVFSVSPVRHLKDGFVENQRSKAHLITAVQKLVASDKVSYFPAYELMMDELRDYRFYAVDMVHPNELAVDYIWEKFRQSWIDEEAYKDMEEVCAIRKGMAHRPNFPESESHQKFLQALQLRTAAIQERYPFMSF
ncbi:GSCFA domain-containing protein [Lentiprolixibacter aurantiacus]|uniref:GSCFA domain-containing protein n=1 Tax=Lentiprolixibacter aurantiacus TaxID=2993939 RepID=A0AAE3MIS2_9FLAO|nr:GSCFA domain-containing protein [Lentiprolixibacter aurantiacus]MCX2717998.1 GSCFA domain-containing protein [Lentiprolixibacter aurantiacus]